MVSLVYLLLFYWGIFVFFFIFDSGNILYFSFFLQLTNCIFVSMNFWILFFFLQLTNCILLLFWKIKNSNFFECFNGLYFSWFYWKSILLICIISDFGFVKIEIFYFVVFKYSSALSKLILFLSIFSED